MLAACAALVDALTGEGSGARDVTAVALTERRRVTGSTDADNLIHAMAEFLLWMEYAEQNGQYYNSYKHRAERKLPTPEGVYYPGEALLALTRLAEQFPDEPYLEAARRAANYLVRVRDGDIPETGEIPREDHWLTIALSELYRVDAAGSFRVLHTFDGVDGAMPQGLVRGAIVAIGLVSGVLMLLSK